MTTIQSLVESEMAFGLAKYGEYHNAHEQYAVMLEEVDEWWERVKTNMDFAPSSHYELIQVAAVALRYVMERGDLEEIRKVQERRHAQ